MNRKNTAKGNTLGILQVVVLALLRLVRLLLCQRLSHLLGVVNLNTQLDFHDLSEVGGFQVYTTLQFALFFSFPVPSEKI